MEEKKVMELMEKTRAYTPEGILKEITNFLPVEKIALATSLSIEDQVITDMIMKVNPEIPIFTLDTGRLFQETYDVLEKTKLTYDKTIEILFPDNKAVEKLITENGPNLFYYSVEKRRSCCKIRKVDQLKRKLSTLDGWICGLRSDQAVTRKNIGKIEWDNHNGLVKVNPLVNWTEEAVWEYIRVHNVPYNRLYDKGYTSIGCAPCTRAIKPGEDLRAGRWWWENPEWKECGLHIKNAI